MLVKVIACNECEYFEGMDGDYGICYKCKGNRKADDFCSLAIPRNKELFIYCPSCGQRISLRSKDNG